jgi:hypothetical protein
VDPHHVYADPDVDSTYHPDADADADPAADPDSDVLFYVDPDADPDPTFHPDADPDFYLMRMRIRMRTQVTKMMRTWIHNIE